jgi:hypothetical protein
MYKLGTLKEADAFLQDIQRLIATNGILFMNGRTKNAQSLAKLGISVAIQKEIINSLTASDYCGGPGPDEKYNWKSIGLFGYNYYGTELYIKFSIGIEGPPVVCLSFHEAEHPMKYQFK